MMKKILFSLFLISFAFFNAQVGPFSWQDHLSLNSANTLAKFKNRIYASNYNGLLVFDLEEESGTRLNKINGLSDVGIRLLRTNPNNNRLLIIYENANIDIIDSDDKIHNYPDIKIKTINGKKGVNEVYFVGNLAYLATGLGIVVFDTDKLEIKDTYVIGPNGTNLEVYQTTLNDSLIFAATPQGLYRANYKKKILNNYSSWTLVPQLPPGIFSGVIKVQDKILASYSPSKINPGMLIDSLYWLNNNVWSRFTPATPNLINKLSYVDGNLFAVIAQFGPLVIDVNTKISQVYITTYNGNDYEPKDIIFFNDKTNNPSYWIADKRFGLFQTYGYHPFYTQNLKSINGTNKSLVSNIDVDNGEVIISPSYPNDGGGTDLNIEGINHYRDNQWEYFNSLNFSNQYIYDFNFVLFDRKDHSRIWASSWSSGLCEFRDHKLINIYNTTNSSLKEVVNDQIRIGGLSMDKDGNLWMANSDVKEYIAVRKANGTFASFNMGAARFTRKLMVDRNNYVWALHERDAGISVYKHDNFTNSVYKLLTKDAGNGNLQSNSVYSIAEDKDGKIWVGTSEGIRVFYNPETVFNTSNFDAEPIKIVQDGNVELLLEKETVTAIVVDGANNKWVGTLTGGLYCFNPDGQKQLYHFTKANSPLYSDNIVALNYNPVTGDVFIGTDLGLQSFRSGIIEGADNYSNIYAFPNPVRPNYKGSVFVKGLIDESIVKITDESGNLVWETKSQGGQVEWPVKNLSGARVASGVYIVYAMVATGELKAATKVVVVN